MPVAAESGEVEKQCSTLRCPAEQESLGGYENGGFRQANRNIFSPEGIPGTAHPIRTDFSENADFAFSFAVDAAVRRPGSQLYLLHVVPESEAQFWKSYIYEVDDVDAKAMHDINQRIDQTYRSRLPEDLELKVEFRIGKDYQEILRFARENRIDLIVMGRQGHNALQKAFFGNVTEKVVSKADSVVLVVPLSYSKRTNGS